MSKQVWFRNNKAAEKFNTEEILNILEDTLNYLKANPEIFLKVDVDIYMMENHSVSPRTRAWWLSKLYKDNISIADAWSLIDSLIKSRLIQREKGIRPNIQNLVLQNDHRMSERREQEIRGGADIIINRPQMPEKK